MRRSASFDHFRPFSLGGGEFASIGPMLAPAVEPLKRRMARRLGMMQCAPGRAFVTRLWLEERIWWDVPGWNC